MLLNHLFKHVNYYFRTFRMQKPFLTGLKLKNSLSNQLVTPISPRKTFSLDTEETSSGILADPLSTLTATSDMQGNHPSIQKLRLQ